MKKDELIQNPSTGHRHVVLLGAGASFAAFPSGDANYNKLPVMNNLVEVVGLTSLLEKNSLNPSGNFEAIYSGIKNNKLRKEIEEKIFQYFISLSLPETVTIYDKLLLSLRQKDAVFTFNWDPFLFNAYLRNREVAPLPNIYFLHGNVAIGACVTCENWGRYADICLNCNIKYIEIPLLYPVEKKDYFNANRYTAMSWENANHWFSEAFTMTIFGYSAPNSDQEAVDLLKKAWFQNSNRSLENVEVIDVISQDQLYGRWKNFLPTGHLLSCSSFEASRLWNWPRRSCEALFYPMSQGLPCEKFPLAETKDLNELQSAIRQISQYEVQN